MIDQVPDSSNNQCGNNDESQEGKCEHVTANKEQKAVKWHFGFLLYPFKIIIRLFKRKCK